MYFVKSVVSDVHIAQPWEDYCWACCEETLTFPQLEYINSPVIHLVDDTVFFILLLYNRLMLIIMS